LAAGRWERSAAADLILAAILAQNKQEIGNVLVPATTKPHSKTAAF
jgi:hypothetical protein